MGNKDTNTDYQKFLREIAEIAEVSEIAEITIENISFAWDSYLIFFIQGVFKFHLKKTTPT